MESQEISVKKRRNTPFFIFYKKKIKNTPLIPFLT
nr:MAG TPA: hypothetical protein [Caudoviricetes sp.]